MKKPTKKLQLTTETIRPLSPEALHAVVGGSLQPAQQGFIMQDTVIVRPFIMKDTVIVPTSGPNR